MIEWDRLSVEEFLGVTSRFEELSSPTGIHPTYTFELLLPTGPILFTVRPTLDQCQFYSNDDISEFVSAFVHTIRIKVNDEPEEEGGMCIILEGKGGHACIRPARPFYHMFFSMYGDRENLNLDHSR